MPRQKYTLADGAEVVGVTTVIENLGWNKNSLMAWSNKIGLKGLTLAAERKRTADAGSLTHLMASRHILGKPMPDISAYPTDVREHAIACYESYLEWRAVTRFHPVASETPMVSERHRYGGCPDAFGVWDGHLALLDFKSSKSVYRETIVQLAAYRNLWDENHPDMPVESAHVLRWRPGGAYHEPIDMASVAAAWDVFLHALQIHRLKDAVKVPKETKEEATEVAA